MQTWGDIRAWRRATRAELLASRLRVPRGEKERVRAAVREFIWEQFPELRHACIGFYWPFKGEIDLRHLVRDFLAVGAEALADFHEFGRWLRPGRKRGHRLCGH